jgi:hypothetical protein
VTPSSPARWVTGLVVCISAAAAGACGSSPASRPTPAQSPDPIPSSAAPADDHHVEVEADEQRAVDEINRVLRQVSRMRKLPARGSVAGRVIDRPTMLRQVKDQVRSQVPMEAIEGESAFLSTFGFIPADYDYEAGVYRLIESQLAGYYDPDQKTMFLMGDLSDAETEVTLAHELVHALQDQYYVLGPRLAYRKDANDAQAAIHCLAEGDATSLMLDFTLDESGLSAVAIPDDRLRLEIVSSVAMSPDMASFPRVLRDSLVAPYVDGVLFVHGLRRRGGWASVDQAWGNPPTTTEQVLHLEKLFAREPADTVPVPTGPSGGTWTTAHTDVYGEQGLRIALEEWMPRRVATDAAAGWGGDRVAVLASTEHDTAVTVAAWHIRFDPSPRGSDDEAVEAFNAIASGWGKSGHRDICHTLSNGRRIVLARKGRDLAMVVGAPDVADGPHPAAACSQLSHWAASVLAQQ